eukprot:8600070-Pyramimonas_sp.AAC.1
MLATKNIGRKQKNGSSFSRISFSWMKQCFSSGLASGTRASYHHADVIVLVEKIVPPSSDGRPPPWSP